MFGKIIMTKYILAFMAMASALYAQEAKVDTLFTVSDLKGICTEFTEGGLILPEPKTQKDGIRDSSIIQVQTDSKGVKKYFLVHNTGQSELVFLSGSNNFTFVEYLGDSIFTYMICFDHKLPDGSYLILTSGTRAGVMGMTSGRLFSGKAQPSPILKAILKDLLEKEK